MNRSQLIRAWLMAQPGPKTPDEIAAARADGKTVGFTVTEIAAGLNKAGDPVIGQTVHRMYREEVLDREGHMRFYRFWLIREIAAPLSRDAARRRRNDNERKRKQREQGRTPREQWLIECAARTKATAEAEKAKKAARALAREQERVRRQARPKPIPNKKPTATTKPDRVQPTLDTPKKAAKPAAAVESVAEWMARTGRKPDVLPDGKVSQPLRFIGHRAENNATWQQRTAGAAK